MSETLPRSASTPNQIDVTTPTTEQLNIIVNGEAPNTQAAEATVEQAEQSPPTLAERIRSAGNRIVGITDMIANKLEQRAAFKSYGENIKTTKRRERGERFDSFVDSATERLNQGVDVVRSIGSSALSAAGEAGTIALGVGVLAGEAIGSGAKQAYEAGKDASETGALKVMYGVDAAKDKIETSALTALYAADSAREKIGSTVESVKMKLSERAEAAKLRREGRRAKWAARKEAALDRGREVIDSTIEQKDRLARKAATIRAAGSAAVTAAVSTYNVHNEQNKV